MNRRQLLAGIAATALVPPVLGKPTSFLAYSHRAADPMLLSAADGVYLMVVPKWVETELQRISSVPERWT